jgi:hypothetical protein
MPFKPEIAHKLYEALCEPADLDTTRAALPLAENADEICAVGHVCSGRIVVTYSSRRTSRRLRLAIRARALGCACPPAEIGRAEGRERLRPARDLHDDQEIASPAVRNKGDLDRFRIELKAKSIDTIRSRAD